MAENVLAYIGIDNFDVVIYQAMILASLDKRVLVIDRSESGALSQAFPKPQGLDLEKEPFTFRHIDMTKMPLSNTLIGYYDDVLVAYGFSDVGEETKYITRYLFVTNMYVHNVERIKSIEKSYTGTKSLLLRETLGIKIVPETIFEAFVSDMSKDMIDYVELFEADYENALICQYNQSYRFTHISKGLKSYLLTETSRLYPNIPIKVMSSAYKQARKGDKR